MEEIQPCLGLIVAIQILFRTWEKSRVFPWGRTWLAEPSLAILSPGRSHLSSPSLLAILSSVPGKRSRLSLCLEAPRPPGSTLKCREHRHHGTPGYNGPARAGFVFEARNPSQVLPNPPPPTPENQKCCSKCGSTTRPVTRVSVNIHSRSAVATR